MRFKRNLYIVIGATVIYFVLVFCYKKIIINDGFEYAYFITKNVSRGDKILEADLNKIKVNSGGLDKYSADYSEGKFYNNDYLEGTVLMNSMIINETEYLKASSDNEIISIKLNLSEDAASYQIEKGSIINIFYSAKLSEIENIYNIINKESLISNNLDSGYVTLKLLEKTKILSCFDKYGNNTKKGNAIETILIEVTKDESIQINNLKNYGKFSVSITK